MKILFLDQYSDLGGAQQCLLDLMPTLLQAGWEAHVGVPGSGVLSERLGQMAATVHSIPCGLYSSERKTLADRIRFAFELPRLAAVIRRLTEQLMPDLIYVNGPRVLPAAALAVGKRQPLLFHCHSHVPESSAAWLVGQAAQRSAATVVSCCRYASQPISPYVPASKLHVIYNGAAEAPHRNRPLNTGVGARIGLIGRVAPQKGQAEFLRAARQLVAVLPRCRFVVAGEALFGNQEAQRYFRSLKELAQGLLLEFLGWHDDVYSLLSDLDLLVVPSTREPGTTRVILEAYANGVPVVAFPTGGIPEILTDGETGFLVTPPTPEALAQRIADLVLNQPHRLAAAAQAGKALWRERFTLERYQRQILDVMARAAGQSRSPAHPSGSARHRRTQKVGHG